MKAPNEAELQQINSLVTHYPYRIVYGMFDKDTGEFFASAVESMRIPNKLTREGHTVFIVRRKK